MAKDSFYKRKMDEIDLSLKKAGFEDDQAIALEDLYGDWGMVYAFSVGPFLCLLPPIVTIIMTVIFKRAKLFGVTQKFVLAIMFLDMCYTTITASRDGLLALFNMNYGFLEYRVCTIVLVSFRIQTQLHSTSIWLKTLMCLHQALIVGLPLKIRQMNLKLIFTVFFSFQTALTMLVALSISTPKFRAIPLIQHYKEGFPLRKILGCQLIGSFVAGDAFFSDFAIVISTSYLTYFQVLPLIIHSVTMSVLVFLLKKHLRVLSVLTNQISGSVERINYIALLKVNIGLGISFFLQEIPIILFNLIQLQFDLTSSFYQGFVITAMSLSFCLGKPVDLMIYSSLSRTFSQNLKKAFCCK